MSIYIKYILIGATSYWVTDGVIQIIHPVHGIWISLLTFAVPITVIFIWYKLHKHPQFYNHPKAFPLLMLLGIWMLGPLGIALPGQFNGGSFLDPDKIDTFFFMWSIFPVSTFIMSTYSGSLGGVILVTASLLIAASRASKSYKASNNAFKRDAEKAPRPLT